MEQLTAVNLGNIFLVTYGETQFMIEAHSGGFKSVVLRQGEPVAIEEVTEFEERLLELAHEKLVGNIVNELPEELFPNVDELVSDLDDILNENGLEDTLLAGANKYLH
ncbi:hypothetical protein ABES25_06055 [Bacillus gobiensis]|uniref:hypothetical protein n=1 Tax=Bacillus gobiensis TaxID=1441095 RepID=UPI003D1B91A7